MDLIVEFWATWLLLSMLCAGMMHFIAKNKKSDIQPGMATKSEHFSMRTIFLSFRSGEAALFFIVLIIAGFFFLFAVGFSKEISGILPGS